MPTGPCKDLHMWAQHTEGETEGRASKCSLGPGTSDSHLCAHIWPHILEIGRDPVCGDRSGEGLSRAQEGSPAPTDMYLCKHAQLCLPKGS